MSSIVNITKKARRSYAKKTIVADKRLFLKSQCHIEFDMSDHMNSRIIGSPRKDNTYKIKWSGKILNNNTIIQ